MLHIMRHLECADTLPYSMYNKIQETVKSLKNSYWMNFKLQISTNEVAIKIKYVGMYDAEYYKYTELITYYTKC